MVVEEDVLNVQLKHINTSHGSVVETLTVIKFDIKVCRSKYILIISGDHKKNN